MGLLCSGLALIAFGSLLLTNGVNNPGLAILAAGGVTVIWWTRRLTPKRKELPSVELALEVPAAPVAPPATTPALNTEACCDLAFSLHDPSPELILNVESVRRSAPSDSPEFALANAVLLSLRVAAIVSLEDLAYRWRTAAGHEGEAGLLQGASADAGSNVQRALRDEYRFRFDALSGALMSAAEQDARKQTSPTRRKLALKAGIQQIAAGVAAFGGTHEHIPEEAGRFTGPLQRMLKGVDSGDWPDGADRRAATTELAHDLGGRVADASPGKVKLRRGELRGFIQSAMATEGVYELRNLARLLLERGSLNEALQCMDAAVEVAQEYKNVRLALADRGRVYLAQGRHRDAALEFMRSAAASKRQAPGGIPDSMAEAMGALGAPSPSVENAKALLKQAKAVPELEFASLLKF